MSFNRALLTSLLFTGLCFNSACDDGDSDDGSDTDTSSNNSTSTGTGTGSTSSTSDQSSATGSESDSTGASSSSTSSASNTETSTSIGCPEVLPYLVGSYSLAINNLTGPASNYFDLNATYEMSVGDSGEVTIKASKMGDLVFAAAIVECGGGSGLRVATWNEVGVKTLEITYHDALMRVFGTGGGFTVDDQTGTFTANVTKI
jgi:hypothetical protein